MSVENLNAFPHTVGNLDDRPNLAADDMKAAFEKDCMDLWNKVCEMIPDLNAKLPASDIVKIISSASTDEKVPTAKAVYSAIADALLGAGGTIAEAIITDWLDEHPEATTTVADGAITNAKLATSFVTPGVAAPYSTAATYTAGDYVFYNGALYRCISDISAAESWTADHWAAVTMGGEIYAVMAGVAPAYSKDAVYPAGSYVWNNAALWMNPAAITVPESWNAKHWIAVNIGDELSGSKRIIGNSVSKEINIKALLGNYNWPLGWRNGSYNSSTGVSDETHRYIRTITGGDAEIVAPRGAYAMRAKAPSGYYISVYEYTPNGAFVKRYGVPNNVYNDGTPEVSFTPTPGNVYKLCIGMTASGVDSATLVTDEFTSQVECVFYVWKVQLDEIDELNEETDRINSVLNIEDTDESVNFEKVLGNSAWPLGWKAGAYDSSTGETEYSTRYIRTITGGDAEIIAPEGAYAMHVKAPYGYYIAAYEYNPNGDYVTRYGVANNLNGDGTPEVDFTPTIGNIYKLCIGMTTSDVDSSTLVTEEFISQIECVFHVRTRSDYDSLIVDDASSYTIVCAKERNYSDGTKPSVDWYLVESPARDFYITKDFYTLKYIFTADYNSFYYKYAVMPNGDIIAVYRTELTSTGASEDNRKNPFVHLASEGWKTAHEVDFGAALKPSGWLENCGFCSMPDGSAMFCEYTRPSVLTANCWKIGGDLTNPSNWVVKKTFILSGEPNSGFKHCHAVQYDFYTGIYYLATGDDDTGAQLWYSSDSGENWTLVREPSEKYCRVLNMVFTEDYIYWASDTTKQNMHYLFRCGRDENGVVDYSSIEELADLYVPSVATYGLAYLEELNALVILDKCDSKKSSMPFRLYDLNDSTLYTIATLESATGETEHIGFRTEYSEFYPNGNYVLCGFGKTLSLATYNNFIKGLGNSGDVANWGTCVNNLRIGIYKTANGYKHSMKTAFMPR